MPILPPGTLITPVALEALEKWKKKGGIANTEIGPDVNFFLYIEANLEFILKVSFFRKILVVWVPLAL